MTNDETTEAVIAWADSLLPELQEPRKAPESDWPLPDVACAIADQRLVDGLVQQRQDYLRDVQLMLAVQPEPHDVASSQLHGFIDTLMDELKNDRTLGGRVAQIEPQGGILVRARFEPAYIETGDGATARQVTLSLTVRDVG